MNKTLLLGLCLTACVAEAKTERIFREARYTRGNTNIVRLQPIDEASWIWHRDDTGFGVNSSTITHDARRESEASIVMVFEKVFEVKPGEGAFEIDVSGDERFYLTCDGEFISRGPHRATMENWQYQSYRLELKPGRHVMRAVVTRLGVHAPLAQHSYRGGFILKASGEFDERLSTGKAEWKVAKWSGMCPSGADNGVWGTGSQFIVKGSGPYAVEVFEWTEPVVVRGPAGDVGLSRHGARTEGWMLYPSQLPDQTERKILPGKAVAATHKAEWRNGENGKSPYIYTASDMSASEVAAFNDFLSGKVATFTVPSNTRLQLAWDLGRYVCAYPVAKFGAAKGARFSWCWTEASQKGGSDLKGGEPGARDAIEGRYLAGYGDIFLPSPEKDGEFSTPWFRCGKWCRLDIETAEVPLVIKSLALVESRYPLEMESDFSSPEEKSLEGIRRISARAMQMCAHEMLFDCPYYEQQMYPGDSRVQLNILSSMSRDERMIRRVIELYDLATRDDGMCPFNWPTRGTQEGFTYTLCYLMMYGDYAMNHTNREWLKSRMPGFRKSLSGC